MSNENISLKVGLDTSQFSSSIAGMTKELKALSKVDLTLLSEEDKKAVVSRMGDLKNSIMDIKKEIDNADPGAFFDSFTTLAGPAIAGLSGLAVGMEMFGAKTEEVDAIQRKLMGVISILSTLQAVADADKLKGLLKQIPLQYLEIKNRLTNIMLIKAETVSTITDTAAKEAGGVTIKKLTILQRLWNLAVSENPILILVAGITALVGGVVALSNAFKENTKAVDETNRSIDGTVYATKELRDIHDEMYFNKEKYISNVKSLLGVYSEYQKKMEDNKIALQEYINEQNKLDKDKVKELGLSGGMVDYLNEAAERYKKAKKDLEDIRIMMMGQEDPSESDPWVMVGKQEEKDRIIKSYEDAVKYEEERIAQIGKNQSKEVDMYLKFLVEKTDKVTEAENQFNRKRNEEALKSAKDLEKELDRVENSNIEDTLVRLRYEYDKRKIEYQERYELVVDENSKLTDAEREYVRMYGELMSALDTDYQNKVKDYIRKTNEEKLKLHNDYYKKLIEDTEESKFKLEETKGINTELDRLKYTYEKQLVELNEFYKKNKLSHQDYIKSKEQLDKQYELNKEIIALKNKNELNKKLLDLEKQYVQTSINEQREAELKELEKQGTESGASPEQMARFRQIVNKKYDDQIYEYRKNLGVTSMNEEMQRELDLIDAKLLSEEEYQLAKSNIIEKYSKVNSQKQMILQQTLDSTIQAGFQLVMEYKQQEYAREYEMMNENFDQRYDLLDKELKYKQITQEEYESRRDILDKKRQSEEKKLRIKQAKDEKLAAIYQIGIETSVAIMKAYSQMGPLASAIIPFIIGQGAINAALVAARPLPAFKTGSQEPFNPNSDSGLALLHKGEMVINSNAVSQRNNMEIIRQLNSNPFSLGSLNYQQMVEYVELSFDKYNEIPVVVKETEMTQIQEKIKNIRINAEV
jgi:hypothetical protein